MEERQRQIREGAGLEESRLNVEFVEFLKRFSTPLLMAIVVISGGYFAWNKYKVRDERLTDEAFAQFDAAIESRNPVTLLRVAEENSRGAVPMLARLSAADVHLDASRTGVPIGVTTEAKGELPKDAQPLTAEQKADEVKKANDLYQRVFDQASGSRTTLELALVALHGLAACAESRGELEAAKGFYQHVIDRATAAGLTEWAERAEHFKTTADDLKTSPKLFATAELPASALANQPFTSDLQNMQMGTTGGQMIRMGPGGKLEVVDPTTLPPGDGLPPMPPAPAPTPAVDPPATPAPAPATPPAAAPPAGEPTKPN